MILGGYSIGYTATQFVGGILSQRVGGKWVFGPAIFLSSILNFILPVMTTNFGIPAIMAIRVIQGMVQGPETPALYTISARWLPAPEKNRMLSFILSGKFDVNKKFFQGTLNMICAIAGLQAGLILSMSSCGWITNSFGWEAPFYLIGCLSCIWFLLWIFLVYNNPREHPRISKVFLG